MKAIYWSDYACPYCYIGEARLKKAIRELNAEDQIALEMKAFQLDPYAGEHAAGDTLTRFAYKYGLTKERAAQQIEGISQLGIAEGLDFKYATTLFTNTMDAHRLTKMAQRRGAADKVIEALFKAYFSDNLELADKELLQRIGEEAGLDAQEVRELLSSDRFKDEVLRDEEEAARNGIHAVPFFVVGDRYGISGAQSVAGMKATLEKALQEEQQRKAALEVESGMTCGPEGCRIQCGRREAEIPLVNCQPRREKALAIQSPGDRISTVRCTLNAVAGREWKYGEGIGKAEEPKKVIVIGAGPGGLEAAYRCAMRGHEVDVYEKSGELCGGQIMAAKASPGKDILNNIPKFYEAQLERMENVHIHLNTEVTEKMVQNMEADAVILATGGHPFVPGIPGIKECKRVVTGPDVLTKKATVTGKVLIAGGGQAGIETAYQLLTEGYEVSIIEMLPELALNEEGMTKMMIMPILEKLGLKGYVSHQILRVNESSLTAKDLKENKEVEIPFDTLVMALGTRPTNHLEAALREKFNRVYLVGDADHAGNIRAAIESGFFTALRV